MLNRLSASAPITQALDALDKDGGVVIEGMFAASTIRTMAEAVESAAKRFAPEYCMPLWPNCAEVTVSAMIALDDVTEELGATRVIPGSHKWETYADLWDGAQTVPAEMKIGDAFIYSGKVVHGGGANLTKDRWRKAMHLSFLVGWLTPEESSPIDYTDEELARFSPRVQRLLGHRSYDPRPMFGGGLWLHNANKIEDQTGLS